MTISDKKIIKAHAKIADQVLKLVKTYRTWTDAKLQAQTTFFKTQITKGKSLDDLLVPAFAVAHEAARRITGLVIYRVQIIGAIILHQGDVAEMRTGEGKTITSVLPAYLNGLSGDGVHIITVNEYLVQRDFTYIGRILKFLKMTVGMNLRDMAREQKKLAYDQDVTYTTSSELGFDYLRDNMASSIEQTVIRKFNFTIIDEADSVLIDEARTPLIISGGKKPWVLQYQQADQFAKSLKKTFSDDVIIDRESRNASLTDTGVKKAEAFFNLKSLFSTQNSKIYHIILNALRANYVFKNGVEYLIKDAKMILIDQNTGRLMEGRSYSDGLQQAIQAKENLEIEDETRILGTITYQNLFRLYAKLSGMTGTAKTEEEEFIKIYNMRVVVVPTNLPVIRDDKTDILFSKRSYQLKSLVEDIKRLHEEGRPILIGTSSVTSSESVSQALQKINLKHEVLNAKNHQREAEIIAYAGKLKAITISTNMAGRGTDIKLGPGVKALGGLVVFGLGRNEARRIDNQLRGRSGRQGDPGLSQFYVSLQDELMRRFAAEKLEKSFGHLGEGYIRSRLLTRGVTIAQKRIEGMNFDQRKNLLDYDNVIAQHREAIYSQRRSVLMSDNLDVILKKMIQTVAYHLVNHYQHEIEGQLMIDWNKLLADIEHKMIFADVIHPQDYHNVDLAKVVRVLSDEIWDFIHYRISDVPETSMRLIIRRIMIQAIDQYWQDHLDLTQKLRHSIYLRSYAQNNPLYAYVQESAKLYQLMKVNIAKQVIEKLTAIVVTSDDLADDPLNDTEQLRVKVGG